MTEKELFEKNLELASEFSRYVIAHPEINDKLPPGCELIFLLDSDANLTKHNLKLAEEIEKEGTPVIFIHVKTILPKETSRLVEPRIELTPK